MRRCNHHPTRQGMKPVTAPGTFDPSHLLCFNCSTVKDSLWIVSNIIDVSEVNECLCCAECLIRNLKEPTLIRDHKISLRCGGESCTVKLDTWTKSPDLVTSLLRDHTNNCSSRPVFCPKGCKLVIKREELSKHEESCEFRKTPEEKESLLMEELEQRLTISPSKLRYSTMADVPLMKRDSRSNVPKSPHETLRREAMNVSRRSSTVDQTDSDESYHSLGYSQRTSPSPAASFSRDFNSLPRRSVSRSPSSFTNLSSPSFRNGGRLSDETLEQLEKARLALEKHGLDIVDGESCLPEVVAQSFNNDDMALRDRLEKVEEVAATTRAQLGKAYIEIQTLRALLASENKLRELHVNKLRDELDILKSQMYRYFSGGRSPKP